MNFCKKHLTYLLLVGLYCNVRSGEPSHELESVKTEEPVKHEESQQEIEHKKELQKENEKKLNEERILKAKEHQQPVSTVGNATTGQGKGKEAIHGFSGSSSTGSKFNFSDGPQISDSNFGAPITTEQTTDVQDNGQAALSDMEDEFKQSDTGGNKKENIINLKPVEKNVLTQFSDWISDLFGFGAIADAKKSIKLAEKDDKRIIASLEPLSSSQKETVLNSWLDSVKSGKIKIDLDKNPTEISDLLTKLNKGLPDNEKAILMNSDEYHRESGLFVKVCTEREMNSIVKANTTDRPHAWRSTNGRYNDYLPLSLIPNHK